MQYDEDDEEFVQRDRRRRRPKKSAQAYYEPDAIERQGLTSRDDDIRGKDVPERFAKESARRQNLLAMHIPLWQISIAAHSGPENDGRRACVAV